MFPAITLAVSLVVAWIYTIVLVPRQVESLFRHRLWRIRDELQDHIFDERLPDVPVVRDLIDALERVIQHSNRITMANYLAFCIVRPLSPENVPPYDLSGLSKPQQAIVKTILDESYRSMKFKVVAGSTVGAFLLPIWLIRYRSQSKSFAEPQTEFRRLQKVAYTLKASQRPRDLIASVG